jgi:tryptophan-rich sensory protein
MNAAAIDYRTPRALIVTIVFVAVVVTVGAVIGINTGPDTWYATLDKPPFNPPNWLFAPVWFTLYVLIGIAGARAFLRDASSPVMFVWVGQMLLNWAWSPTWFTLHLLWPAFVIIAAIFALIATFIALTWKEDRLSALLFVPYALWVGFASMLNLSIALIN